MLFELSSVVVILPAWGFFSMCAGISSFPHSRIEFKGLGSRNRGGETFQHQFSYLNFFIVNSFFLLELFSSFRDLHILIQYFPTPNPEYPGPGLADPVTPACTSAYNHGMRSMCLRATSN